MDFQGDIVEEELPSKINDYEIVKRLGKPSSFGAVYHAKHKNSDVSFGRHFLLIMLVIIFLFISSVG